MYQKIGSGHKRLYFNACLTASSEVSIYLPNNRSCVIYVRAKGATLNMQLVSWELLHAMASPPLLISCRLVHSTDLPCLNVQSTGGQSPAVDFPEANLKPMR